jgi:putative Ca2+/H+ antiporter (TMEM165/GDT1 family)
VAAVFLLRGLFLLRGPRGHGDVDGDTPEGEREDRLLADRQIASGWRVAARSFGIIFVAEFGDLTQIVTANLAAHYSDPIAVGIGAVLALWAVGGLSILGGRRLQRVMSLPWVTRLAAIAMIVLAAFSLVSAING